MPMPVARPNFSASSPPGFKPAVTALAIVAAGSTFPVVANWPIALDAAAAPAAPAAPPPKAPLTTGPSVPAVIPVAATDSISELASMLSSTF